MNKTYAMIQADNVVLGCAAWDGSTPWTPPPGIQMLLGLQPGESCGPGWTYDAERSPRFAPPPDADAGG